jgi:hypothetical protein
MSGWNEIVDFAVAHEVCTRQTKGPKLADREDPSSPGVVHVTVSCEGCGASLTVPVNVATMEEDAEEEVMALGALLSAVSGKSLTELEALSEDERCAYWEEALKRSPRFYEQIERLYQEVQARLPRH